MHVGLHLTRLSASVLVLFASSAVCQSIRDSNAARPSKAIFTSLLSFDSANGFDPETPLVQGLDGSLYGTTYQGGAYNYEGTCSAGCGTVFKTTTEGVLTTLYNFCAFQNGLDACTDGWGPHGLVLGTDGNFYDTTESGGSATAVSIGTIFKLMPGGSRTQLFAFKEFGGCKQDVECYGVYPLAGLVEASDKNLYGTAVDGGTGGGGVVLRVNPMEPPPPTVLYNFSFPDVNPSAPLIQGTDGNLYGTSTDVGMLNSFTGAVFRLTLEGGFTTLYNFCSQPNCADGSRPYSPVVQATNGNFYGTTSAGGSTYDKAGTIFELTPTGVLSTLHTFCVQSPCSDGEFPVGGLVQGTDGNLYGVAPYGGVRDQGVIFRITTGGAFTVLHNFDGSDGQFPDGGLMQATNGLFYGTTTVGGSAGGCLGEGCGTVFSFDVGLAPFVAFVLPSGKIGDSAEILGQGFTGTTSVTFNGVPSEHFEVVSDTYLTATVPVGTTTGSVTVATPNGTLKSNKSF